MLIFAGGVFRTPTQICAMTKSRSWLKCRPLKPHTHSCPVEHRDRGGTKALHLNPLRTPPVLWEPSHPHPAAPGWHTDVRVPLTFTSCSGCSLWTNRGGGQKGSVFSRGKIRLGRVRSGGHCWPQWPSLPSSAKAFRCLDESSTSVVHIY